MAALHFTLGQEEYRLGFRYEAEQIEKEGTLRTHNRSITYTDTRTQRTVHALLLKKVAGPWIDEDVPTDGKPQREYHWEAVLVASTRCSAKDNYDKRRGREIALGRLFKVAPPEMRPLIRNAYDARLDQPMPQVKVREVPQ